MSKLLTEKQRYWSAHLQSADQTEGSIADYARLNNLPVRKLYQWRSSFRKQLSTVSTETVFAQAVVYPDNESSGLKLSLASAELNFSGLPDPHWLASFLALSTQL